MFRIFVSFLYIYFIILRAIYFVRIKRFLKQLTYILYHIYTMTRSKDSFLSILLFIFSLESSSLPVVSTLSQSRRSRNYNSSCPFYCSATPPAITVITVSNVSLPFFLSIVLPLSTTMLCRYLCYKSLYRFMKCSLSVRNLF